ncbi:MAG: hypothetical protein HQ553_14715 [Chloroflexi bacterium]|nr:hypothetical protein [Chloroflexota bacterium]
MPYLTETGIEIEPIGNDSWQVSCTVIIDEDDFEYFDDIYVERTNNRFHVDTSHHRWNGKRYFPTTHGQKEPFMDVLEEEIQNEFQKQSDAGLI